MPHKKIDCEEWCCQYCQTYSDKEFDKVIYHEMTEHHIACTTKKNGKI